MDDCGCNGFLRVLPGNDLLGGNLSDFPCYGCNK